MKILYLCPDYGIPVLGNKGASVHVRELIAAFDRAGHQVALVAPVATKSPWEKPAPLAAQFVHEPLHGATLAMVREIDDFASRLEQTTSLSGDTRRILYDRQLSNMLTYRFTRTVPDLIYARASLYSTAPVALARATGRPLLVELNAPLAAEHTAYRQGRGDDLAPHAEATLIRGADAVLIVSQSLREHAERCGAPPGRIHVVPNAIDPAQFRPGVRDRQLKRRWGLTDAPVLGFVGGLRPWHGVEILPQLLDRMNRAFPGVQLMVVGDGPLRAGLEADLARRGLHGQAVFTGAQPHRVVPPLIRLFDIGLAPYPRLDHAFYFSPLKLFEYMACGVPVVAARLGQIEEIIKDGVNGLLYATGNTQDLIERCSSLLEDQAMRKRIGGRAARDIHANHTWDVNAKLAIDIAEQVNASKETPWPLGASPTP